MICNAVCHIYSGRPNPEWKLTKEQVEEVDRIWENLEETFNQEKFPSFLGYRGISLVCENEREYFVFNKRVKCKTKKQVSWKSDIAGSLEKFLLSTAPKGILPAELFNNL